MSITLPRITNHTLFESITVLLGDTINISENGEIIINEEHANITHLSSLNSLQNNLKYTDIVEMLHHLSLQFGFLTRRMMVPHTVDMDDIYLIKNTYVFINEIKLLPIEDDKTYGYLTMPIDFKYLPPELQDVELTLPMKIHKNTYLYSLGCLVIEILFGKQESMSKTNYDKLLKTTHYRILAKCIERCLQEDPADRLLLVI